MGTKDVNFENEVAVNLPHGEIGDKTPDAVDKKTDKENAPKKKGKIRYGVADL